MKSMTGYGAGAFGLGARRVIVEARSVNHRFLDVRIQLPEELDAYLHDLEQTARAELGRGRYDLRVRIDGDSGAALILDGARARSAFQALSTLRDELAPGAELPLSLLAAVPDLFRPATPSDDVATREALLAATRAALEDLSAMRAREGEALARELEALLARVEEHVDAIEEASAGLVVKQRTRLRERVALLIEQTDLDAGRLELEIALLADRSDVTEELVRLRSHVAQARKLFATTGPMGRRVDFLLQEMGRETNTIGSKSPDAAIAHRVVDLKALLERLRQQIQNVE